MVALSISVLRNAVVSSFAYGGIEHSSFVVSLFTCGGICLLAGSGALLFLLFSI